MLRGMLREQPKQCSACDIHIVGCDVNVGRVQQTGSHLCQGLVKYLLASLDLGRTSWAIVRTCCKHSFERLSATSDREGQGVIDINSLTGALTIAEKLVIANSGESASLTVLWMAHRYCKHGVLAQRDPEMCLMAAQKSWSDFARACKLPNQSAGVLLSCQSSSCFERRCVCKHDFLAYLLARLWSLEPLSGGSSVG